MIDSDDDLPEKLPRKDIESIFKQPPAIDEHHELVNKHNKSIALIFN